MTSGAIFLVIIGGGYYEAGIGQTTLTGTIGNDSPSSSSAIRGHGPWWWRLPPWWECRRARRGERPGTGGRRWWCWPAQPAGAARAGPYPHVDLAGQARGLRCPVRGHRGGLRRGTSWSISAGAAGCGSWPRSRSAPRSLAPAHRGAAQSRSLVSMADATPFDSPSGTWPRPIRAGSWSRRRRSPSTICRRGPHWQFWSNTRSAPCRVAPASAPPLTSREPARSTTVSSAATTSAWSR